MAARAASPAPPLSIATDMDETATIIPGTAPEIVSEHKRYNDARLLNDFDINDPRYLQEFKWTIGPNKESRNWRYDDRTPDVRTLIERLSQHREDKSKDG